MDRMKRFQKLATQRRNKVSRNLVLPPSSILLLLLLFVVETSHTDVILTLEPTIRFVSCLDFIGSYYHPLFQQGRKELTTKMLRHFTSKTSIASHRGQSKKKETAQQCPTGDKQHGQPSSLDDKEEFDLILDGIESILSDGDSSSSQGGYNISMPKDNKQLKPCSVFVPPKGPGYLAAPCREIKFENAFSVTAAWNYSSSSTHQNHFLSENHWFEFASSSMEDMQQFDHEDIRREIVKTFMHTQIQLD